MNVIETGDQKPAAFSGIEAAARELAVIAVCAYGVGFLVVSLHHAQFGIAQSDPFRPKIILSGFVFLLLAGSAVVIAMGSFGVRGLSRPTIITITSQPQNAAALRLSSFFDFYYISYALTATFGFLFTVHPLDLRILWWFPTYVVVAVFQKLYFDKRPGLCAILSIILSVGLCITVKRYDPLPEFLLSLWFFAIGGLTMFFHTGSSTRGNKSILSDWHVWVPSLSTLLIVYSAFIYPDIRASWGGGKAAPITMYFSEKTPLSTSDSLQVRLIDQTSDGYYFLLADDKQAYFVRHDLVSAIHYNGGATHTNSFAVGSGAKHLQ